MRLFSNRELILLGVCLVLSNLSASLRLFKVVNKQITEPICTTLIFVMILSIIIAIVRYVKKYES